MNIHRSLICLALLILASSVAFGQCDNEGDAQGTPCAAEQSVPEATAPVGGEVADADSTEQVRTRTYTWDDLLTLVPELRDYELGSRRNRRDEDAQPNYVVCRKFKKTGTHIPQRRCLPIQDFIVYVASQRRRAEQTRINILLRPSPPPPVIRN